MMASHTAAPRLETPRLHLRLPQEADAAANLAFMQSDRARLMVAPMSEAEALADFARVIGMWRQRGFGLFAICLKGGDRSIGLAGPWMPDDHPEPEIGWNLWDAGVEGRGFATEAARAARDWAFRSLGWTTAVSYIHPANTRSIAVAERLGARRDTQAEAEFDDPVRVYRHSPEARP